MELKLSKDIIQIIENCGFSINIEKQNTGNELFNGYCADLNQSTPEGEDWWESITFDGTDRDFIKEIRDRAYYFDVDEEVEVWIPHRGKDGCPSSILALVEDAQWKKKKLSELSSELGQWLYEEERGILKFLNVKDELIRQHNIVAHNLSFKKPWRFYKEHGVDEAVEILKAEANNQKRNILFKGRIEL